jgi:hypothetical protein
MLSSSIPLAVVPALPFVFLSNELHVVPHAVMQNEQLPLHVQVTKVYYSAHVDSMRREFESVKELGPATTEEWLKGLDDRGKNLRSDSSRWEKWLVSGASSLLRISTQSNPFKPARSQHLPGRFPSKWHVTLASWITRLY